MSVTITNGNFTLANYSFTEDGLSPQEFRKKLKGDLFSERTFLFAHKTDSLASTFFSVICPHIYDQEHKREWKNSHQVIAFIADTITNFITIPFRLFTLPFMIANNNQSNHCHNDFEKLLSEKFNIKPYQTETITIKMNWETQDSLYETVDIYEFHTHSARNSSYMTTNKDPNNRWLDLGA